MVSAWWLVWAFFLGGYAGMLLLSLLQVFPSEVDDPEPPLGSEGGIARRG